MQPTPEGPQTPAGSTEGSQAAAQELIDSVPAAQPGAETDTGPKFEAPAVDSPAANTSPAAPSINLEPIQPPLVLMAPVMAFA
jgi:hypothetical protein